MITLKLQGFQQAKETLIKEMDKYVETGYATVGFHEKNNARADGETNAEIAMKNHFGSGNIPARPFLDVGVESVISKMNLDAEEVLKKGGSPYKALDVMAETAVGGVKTYIGNLYYPPNSPYTIKMKGSSHPLIATASMRQAVSKEVHKK